VRTNFDLNLLRIAVALYDEQSVTRAATKLRMSQPSVSMALKKLRETLADPLFIKTGAGMTPTPRSHRLVAEARRILVQVEEGVLADMPFDPATTEFTVSIALSDVGEMVFLPRILERVKALAPLATIRSVSAPPAQLQSGLEAGDIDLAVGYFPDLRKSNFVQQRLFNHHFICLLRADHPIRGDRLSIKQFLELEHAVVHAEGRSQEILERYLARQKIERKVVLHTPHFMSLPMIIARTDLVATVPHAIGVYWSRSATNIRTLFPPFDIPRIVLRQHWHRRFQNDARNKWLRGIVRELFSSETDEWRIATSDIETRTSSIADRPSP
jgi:DNA-binding transcriptional LysR family regulator